MSPITLRRPISKRWMTTTSTWTRAVSTVMPDQAGNLATLVSIGKDGTIYLLNPFNLGGYDPSGDQVIQELPNVIPTVLSSGAVFCESAFFDNTLFVFGAADAGEAFPYTPNAAQPLATTPTSITASTCTDTAARCRKSPPMVSRTASSGR